MTTCTYRSWGKDGKVTYTCPNPATDRVTTDQVIRVNTLWGDLDSQFMRPVEDSAVDNDLCLDHARAVRITYKNLLRDLRNLDVSALKKPTDPPKEST